MARFESDFFGPAFGRRSAKWVFPNRSGGGLHRRHELRLRLLAHVEHNPVLDARSNRAFVGGNRTNEQLGESMAEAFLKSATSGEASELSRLDRVTITQELEPYTLALALDDLESDDEDFGIPTTTPVSLRRRTLPASRH